MGKYIVIVLFVLVGIFLFILYLKSGECGSLAETECRANFACKPFYEYGLSCGEDGCKEGERFKGCIRRF